MKWKTLSLSWSVVLGWMATEAAAGEMFGIECGFIPPLPDFGGRTLFLLLVWGFIGAFGFRRKP